MTIYFIFQHQFNTRFSRRKYLGTIHTTLSKILSGTFLSWSYTPLTDECENMTGARVTSKASDIVLLETWERSTSIPILFISLTMSSPNFDKPLFRTGTVVSIPELLTWAA